MIDALSLCAAFALRDGCDLAIKDLERQFKIDFRAFPQHTHAYYEEQMQQQKAALAELRTVRAAVHKRCWEACQ